MEKDFDLSTENEMTSEAQDQENMLDQECELDQELLQESEDSSNPDEDNGETEKYRPIRHTAVSVWLWLFFLVYAALVITDFVVAPNAAMVYAKGDKLSELLDESGAFVVNGMFIDLNPEVDNYFQYRGYVKGGLTILCLISIMLLLSWRKFGFWLNVVASSAVCILMLSLGFKGGFSMPVTANIFWAIAVPVALIAIMKKEEFGISYWELLHHKLQYRPHSSAMPLGIILIVVILGWQGMSFKARQDREKEREEQQIERAKQQAQLLYKYILASFINSLNEGCPMSDGVIGQVSSFEYQPTYDNNDVVIHYDIDSQLAIDIDSLKDNEAVAKKFLIKSLNYKTKDLLHMMANADAGLIYKYFYQSEEVYRIALDNNEVKNAVAQTVSASEFFEAQCEVLNLRMPMEVTPGNAIQKISVEEGYEVIDIQCVESVFNQIKRNKDAYKQKMLDSMTNQDSIFQIEQIREIKEAGMGLKYKCSTKNGNEEVVITIENSEL